MKPTTYAPQPHMEKSPAIAALYSVLVFLLIALAHIRFFFVVTEIGAKAIGKLIC